MSKSEVQIIIFDRWGNLLIALPNSGPFRTLDNVCPGLDCLLDVVKNTYPELLHLPLRPQGTPCSSMIFRGFGRFSGICMLIATGLTRSELAQPWLSGSVQTVRPEDEVKDVSGALEVALEAYRLEHSPTPDGRLIADALARMIGLEVTLPRRMKAAAQSPVPDAGLLSVQILLTLMSAKQYGTTRVEIGPSSLPYRVELSFYGSEKYDDNATGVLLCRRLADTYDTLYMAHCDDEGVVHVVADACLRNSALFGIKSEIQLRD